MLKIIMGSDEIGKFNLKDKFILNTSKYFNTVKEANWFRKDIVKDIISEIDDAEILSDFALYSRKMHTGYSVNDLSGGSKYLILTLCKTEKIYLATMGNNCTNLLERITLEYAKQDRDLMIVSNYLHEFNFKYIKRIKYLNWDIDCTSKKDILNLIGPLWNKKWALPKDFGEDYWEDE